MACAKDVRNREETKKKVQLKMRLRFIRKIYTKSISFKS